MGRTPGAKNKPKSAAKKITLTNPPLSPTEELFKCTSCGKVFKSQWHKFRKTSSPLYESNNGFTTVCVACIDAYEDELTRLYNGDNDRACERLCQIFDWYVNEDILKMSKRSSSKQTRIGDVISKGGLGQHKREDGSPKTYEDRIEELASRDKIESADDLKEVNSSTGYKLTQKTLKFWGPGYSPDEYVYLNNQYDDWSQRHECKSKVQERLFKNLCLVELQIERASQANDDQAIARLMKSFNDLLGSANIKPVQNKENALADQNTFGTLIQKWENERPIPEPDPEWQDVDGIGRYIKVYFLGHLCKMLGIHNSYSVLYDEEMAQYTVNKPQYEEDSEMSFDEIFGVNKDESAAENGGGDTG